jgi:hypothetical protein
VKIGSLVKYVGPWIPGVFPEDKTREPQNYGIIIEYHKWCEGTNVCVYWTEAEDLYWHEESELSVISE